MPQRVQDERFQRPLIVLVRFFVDDCERTRVLLLKAGMVYVPTPSRRGPHPPLRGPSCAFPAAFENSSDAGRERQYPSGRGGLAERNQQCAVPAVHPTDGLPAQPTTFIRS
jgi:hypothetical protein